MSYLISLNPQQLFRSLFFLWCISISCTYPCSLVHRHWYWRRWYFQISSRSVSVDSHRGYVDHGMSYISGLTGWCWGLTIADEDFLAWLMPMWVVFSWCYWRWHGQDDVKYFLKCLHKSWCWRWLGTDNAPHSDVIVMTATPHPPNLLSSWGILGAKDLPMMTMTERLKLIWLCCLFVCCFQVIRVQLKGCQERLKQPNLWKRWKNLPPSPALSQNMQNWDNFSV